jgi:hypothetical protein
VVARIVLWNLADSKTTIEELRRYLRDAEAQLSRLGLAFD